MSTRNNPNRHFVRIDSNRLIRVAAGRWRDWVEARLLIPIGDRIAKPAKAGVFRIENGVIHYPEQPKAPWMVLNCRIIERHALYDQRGPVLKPEQLRRMIQAAYGGID